MALDIGKLVGYIELDASGVGKGINQANQAIGQAGRQWEQTAGQAGDRAGKATGSKLTSALKTSLMGLGAGIIAGIGLQKVTDFFRSTVGAASDLEQSIGGADAVFGKWADNVHTKSKQAAQSLGLSKNEFNELITVSGALLKNKGLETYAQDAENLLQVGADLAAQFGGPTSQAVEALNAAMRGESDPIERYGISLNEAAVNAKMLEMGLTGLEGAALEQGKTQARLALIMEQSADAQGAFAREADTAAGKAERQRATMENLRAEIGERLLPVYHAWLDFMANTGTPALAAFSDGALDVFEAIGRIVSAGGDVLEFFQGLPGPIQAVVIALAGMKVANLVGLTDAVRGITGKTVSNVRNLGGAMDGARLQAMYMGDAFKGAQGKAAGLRAAIGVGGRAGLSGAMNGLKTAGSGVVSFLGGPWGIALLGAATAVGWWVKSQQDAEQKVDELRSTLDEQTGAINDNSEAWFKNQLQQDGVYDAADKLGVPLSLVTDAAMGNSDALADLNARYEEFKTHAAEAARENGRLPTELAATSQAWADVNEAVDGSNEVLGEARAELDQLARASGDSAGAVSGLATGFELGAPAASDFADAVDDVADSSEDAAQETRDLAEAMVAVVDAAFSARDAEVAYEAALDSATDSLKENGETLDITTEKGRENRTALDNLAEAARNSATANLENGDSLESVRDQMSQSRTDFINLATDFGMSKKAAGELATQLGLTEGDVDDLAASIDALPPQTKIEVIEEGADPSTGRVMGLKAEITTLDGKTVTIDESGSSSAAARVGLLSGQILGLQSKSVTITTRYVSEYVVRGRDVGARLGIPGRATGGPVPTSASTVIGYATGGGIHGPGTGTSDSIPAVGPGGMAIRLSNGEHIWTDAEVRALGGHGAMESLRAMVRAGMVPVFDQPRGFASGGAPTGPATIPTTQVTESSDVRLEGQLELRGGDAWFVGMLRRNHRETGRVATTALRSGRYTG